jgi:hypothetical protein
VESEPITEDTAPRPSRQSRATTALFITGAFTIFAILLYSGTISSVPAIGAVTLAGPVIGAVVELVVAFGLASRLQWANAAMTPVLWILGLSGVLTFLVSLGTGRLDIPIGAILVIWALRAPPSSTPDPAPGRSTRTALAPILVGALLFAVAWPVIAPTATQPGGPLLAASTDLHLELTATPCVGDGGVADNPPDAVEVVVRWTWARAEPMHAGIDAVVLKWATMGGPEGSGGFFLDEPVQQLPGITEEDRSGMVAVYRNDLNVRGFEPGSVTIRLRRPTELASGPGLVQVAATYAHHYNGQFGTTPAGLWTRAEVTNCDW